MVQLRGKKGYLGVGTLYYVSEIIGKISLYSSCCLYFVFAVTCDGNGLAASYAQAHYPEYMLGINCLPVPLSGNGTGKGITELDQATCRIRVNTLRVFNFITKYLHLY